MAIIIRVRRNLENKKNNAYLAMGAGAKSWWALAHTHRAEIIGVLRFDVIVARIRCPVLSVAESLGERGRTVPVRMGMLGITHFRGGFLVSWVYRF